ncbi:MAG: hypothetical protein ACPGU7_02295 [Gammaproteobacteria bacterium]
MRINVLGAVGAALTAALVYFYGGTHPDIDHDPRFSNLCTAFAGTADEALVRRKADEEGYAIVVGDESDLEITHVYRAVKHRCLLEMEDGRVVSTDLRLADYGAVFDVGEAALRR